jgi:2-polyprenyl-3-methyl-5-hydroxy-6-metoxy-1,4-benzoquinol methylase
MSHRNAIDFHSAIAAEFSQKYESSRAFQERFRVLTGLFERYIKPEDQVLDLGCGSGVFSNYLAHKGCTVTGIDGSAAMIMLCQQIKTSATVRYVVQSLPLTNPAQYTPQDTVLMSSVLEYLDDMSGMLEQTSTLLKSGGLLIVSIPNKMSVYRTIERLLFRLIKRPNYYRYIRHTTTEASFNRVLAEFGFDALETTYFSGHDPVSRVLKPLLAAHYVNNLLVGVYRKRNTK